MTMRTTESMQLTSWFLSLLYLLVLAANSSLWPLLSYMTCTSCGGINQWWMSNPQSRFTCSKFPMTNQFHWLVRTFPIPKFEALLMWMAPAAPSESILGQLKKCPMLNAGHFNICPFRAGSAISKLVKSMSSIIYGILLVCGCAIDIFEIDYY